MIKWLRNLFTQPPQAVRGAFNSVNARLVYKYYTSDTKTLRHGDATSVLVIRQNIPAGTPANHRNCVGFALAYREAYGGGTIVNKKTLKSGEMHAVLHVRDENGRVWELDNFARAPRLITR